MNPWQKTLHGIYIAHQSAHSAWIRQRYAADFDQVEKFCLFVGYPRSGHSLVGAMLNAHPDAVIAHELVATDYIDKGCSRDPLYARIIARAQWFNLRGNRANYPYQVPTGWQGKYRQLKLIGDKRGGAVSRHIGAHPDFLPRLRTLVGVPLRLIHVLRNPFDNISAISIADGRPLNESIDFYFLHCATTSRLGEICADDEVVTLHHEQMFPNPQGVLSALCSSLGLEPTAEYLAACSSVMFPAPTFTRRKVNWPAKLILETESRLRAIPFLREYAFDDDR